MISRYEVWINDVALSSVDPDIYITDISYPTVSRGYDTSAHAGQDGAYTGKARTESNGVSVAFMVRKYGTSERMAAVQAICAWCVDGGWVKTSDRPGQRMYVRCTRLPAVSSVMRWTDTVTVDFVAHDFPFWTDVVPQEKTLASGASGTMNVVTLMDAPVEAVITATEALTGFTLTVGDTAITLSGITVAAQGTVEISYTDDHHILQIKSGDTSLLDKRTAASSDDLLAKRGANAVAYTSTGASSCEIRVKGVWA